MCHARGNVLCTEKKKVLEAVQTAQLCDGRKNGI